MLPKRSLNRNVGSLRFLALIIDHFGTKSNTGDHQYDETAIYRHTVTAVFLVMIPVMGIQKTKDVTEDAGLAHVRHTKQRSGDQNCKQSLLSKFHNLQFRALQKGSK